MHTNLYTHLYTHTQPSHGHSRFFLYIPTTASLPPCKLWNLQWKLNLKNKYMSKSNEDIGSTGHAQQCNSYIGLVLQFTRNSSSSVFKEHGRRSSDQNDVRCSLISSRTKALASITQNGINTNFKQKRVVWWQRGDDATDNSFCPAYTGACQIAFGTRAICISN